LQPKKAGRRRKEEGRKTRRTEGTTLSRYGGAVEEYELDAASDLHEALGGRASRKTKKSGKVRAKDESKGRTPGARRG